MSRHRKPVAGRTSSWRIATALLGVISLVVALAVTGTASAATASPWRVTAEVALTPTGGLPEGGANTAALKLTALAPGSTVDPGTEITYVLQVTNVGGGAEGDVVTVVDDLSGLLGHASVTSTPDQLQAAGLALDTDEGVLTWTPSSAIGHGQYATTTFQVTVDDDVTGKQPLTTAAAPRGETCDVTDCATALTVQGAAEPDATVQDAAGRDASSTGLNGTSTEASDATSQEPETSTSWPWERCDGASRAGTKGSSLSATGSEFTRLGPSRRGSRKVQTRTIRRPAAVAGHRSGPVLADCGRRGGLRYGAAFGTG